MFRARPPVCFPKATGMGSVLSGDGCDLLRSVCRSRHGIGSIVERHWLLDRGRARLGMDLGAGKEALEGAYPRTELRRPEDSVRQMPERKVIRRQENMMKFRANIK